MNTDILGISELKWTRMGEFNPDDHCIYYCVQESLRRNEVAITDHEESKAQNLGEISKTTEYSLFISKTIQCHSNPSLCPTTNLKKLTLNRSMKIYKTF